MANGASVTVIRKVIDWTLDAFTVLAVGIVIFAVVNHYRNSDSDIGVGPQLRKGSEVPPVEGGWPKSKTTLIFAINPGCIYCAESAEFYKDIVLSDEDKSLDLIAVSPQPSDAVRTYLQSLGVAIPTINRVDFENFGVKSTPTLILVDNSGHIKSTWVGKLDAKQEDLVFATLHLRRNRLATSTKSSPTLSDNDPDIINAEQATEAIRKTPFFPIIDIRPRSSFNKRHLTQSISMPLIEIEARAKHEIPKGAQIIVYCAYSPACESLMKSQGIATTCSLGRSTLEKDGFRVKLLLDDIDQLDRSGMATAKGISLDEFTYASEH